MKTQRSIRPRIAWSAKGRSSEDFYHETQSSVLSRGQGLPGMVWSLGKPCWIADVRQSPAFLRQNGRRLNGYVFWVGRPVRVGNQVIAVVECFSVSSCAKILT